MTDLQADLPDKFTLGDSCGLGWIRFGWNGRRLIGHDGNTIGQSAFLRLLADEGLAVTLLTNGGSTRDLYEDLYREIFSELADVDMPRPLSMRRPPIGCKRTYGVTPEHTSGPVLGSRCSPERTARSCGRPSPGRWVPGRR
jgi:hypothetical protein